MTERVRRFVASLRRVWAPLPAVELTALLAKSHLPAPRSWLDVETKYGGLVVDDPFAHGLTFGIARRRASGGAFVNAWFLTQDGRFIVSVGYFYGWDADLWMDEEGALYVDVDEDEPPDDGHMLAADIQVFLESAALYRDIYLRRESLVARCVDVSREGIPELVEFFDSIGTRLLDASDRCQAWWRVGAVLVWLSPPSPAEPNRRSIYGYAPRDTERLLERLEGIFGKYARDLRVAKI